MIVAIFAQHSIEIVFSKHCGIKIDYINFMKLSINYIDIMI